MEKLFSFTYISIDEGAVPITGGTVRIDEEANCVTVGNGYVCHWVRCKAEQSYFSRR